MTDRVADDADTRIDPDPWLIAGVALQAAAVLLVLVQIARAETHARTRVAGQTRMTRIEKLDAALEGFDRSLSRTERLVRRLSDNPEKELYGAPARVSHTAMMLSPRDAEEFLKGVAEAGTKINAVTIWTSSIIHHDPELAHEIGSEILSVTGDAAGRINAMLAEGAPIEGVLRESEGIRKAAAAAVSRRMNDRGN